jgi:hypothetical protein
MCSGSRSLAPPTSPVWVWLLGALALIGGIGAVENHHEAKKPDRELCQLLSDPQYDNLHPSDWRDMSGFTQAQLTVYVDQRCPENSFKVLDG